VELEKVRFKSDSDVESFMENVEEGRVSELYPHQPNERCIKKGLYVYIAVAIVVIHGSHAVLYTHTACDYHVIVEHFKMTNSTGVFTCPQDSAIIKMQSPLAGTVWDL